MRTSIWVPVKAVSAEAQHLRSRHRPVTACSRSRRCPRLGQV